jgi:hypothetical protein
VETLEEEEEEEGPEEGAEEEKEPEEDTSQTVAAPRATSVEAPCREMALMWPGRCTISSMVGGALEQCRTEEHEMPGAAAVCRATGVSSSASERTSGRPSFSGSVRCTRSAHAAQQRL